MGPPVLLCSDAATPELERDRRGGAERAGPRCQGRGEAESRAFMNAQRFPLTPDKGRSAALRGVDTVTAFGCERSLQCSGNARDFRSSAAGPRGHRRARASDNAYFRPAADVRRPCSARSCRTDPHRPDVQDPPNDGRESGAERCASRIDVDVKGDAEHRGVTSPPTRVRLRPATAPQAAHRRDARAQSRSVATRMTT
jgi:hypothetical protein